MAQWKRASSRVEAGTSGFIYISDSDHTVPAELEQETQAFSCVEERNSTCLSSSSRDDRPLVNLCLESACFSVLCMGVSVPLRVVHSSTGLLSKRCPGIGFLLRSDREIGVFPHVASPTSLRLEFPSETGLILWCAGNVGTPCRQSRRLDPPVAIRRGEGAQMRWCREPRCSPPVRPVCRGTFGVASKVQSTVSHFKMERKTSFETL